MSEGKCSSVCQHPGCWEGGRRKSDNVFYASVLQKILSKRRARLLDERKSTSVERRSSSLPFLTVNTLNSEDYHLPPITQKSSGKPSVPAPKRDKTRKLSHSPRVQENIHKVDVCIDQCPASAQWSDYDFVPVYIWVPKEGKKARQKTRSADNESVLKTTYLNDAVSLPTNARRKKKRRTAMSPAAKWYGDLNAEFLSDLLDMPEDQLLLLLEEAHLSGSSRNESRTHEHMTTELGHSSTCHCGEERSHQDGPVDDCPVNGTAKKRISDDNRGSTNDGLKGSIKDGFDDRPMDGFNDGIKDGTDDVIKDVTGDGIKDGTRGCNSNEVPQRKVDTAPTLHDTTSSDSQADNGVRKSEDISTIPHNKTTSDKTSSNTPAPTTTTSDKTSSNTPAPTATSDKTSSNTPAPTATSDKTSSNTPAPTATTSGKTSSNTPAPTTTSDKTSSNTPAPTTTSDKTSSNTPAPTATSDKTSSNVLTTTNISLSHVGRHSAGCIQRYPYGNPSLGRIPRTTSHPPHPLSLQSSDYYSTAKLLQSLEEGLTDDFVSVAKCSLATKKQKQNIQPLPPVPFGAIRVPPPTANFPNRNM